jgi:hypothetical protein
MTIGGDNVRGDAPLTVVLEPGWNHFGYRFAFPVAWDAVTKPAEEVGESLRSRSCLLLIWRAQRVPADRTSEGLLFG